MSHKQSPTRAKTDLYDRYVDLADEVQRLSRLQGDAAELLDLLHEMCGLKAAMSGIEWSLAGVIYKRLVSELPDEVSVVLVGLSKLP